MLVWDNAMTFNRPEHFVHQVGALAVQKNAYRHNIELPQ